MSKLDPAKLITIFHGVTPENPIIPRKYTLTHSDVTAELFLTIALRFDYMAISPMRDEVLAQWRKSANGYILFGRVQVDARNGNKATSAVRYRIFKQELPLALSAIRLGDDRLFQTHPCLDDAPIRIAFVSNYSEFRTIEYLGKPSQYRVKDRL